MGFLSTLLGTIGLGIGFPIGIILGYYFFIRVVSKDVKEPVITPLQDLDYNALIDILPEVPMWMKNPDYERVDWINKFVADMWPCLDKAVCNIIRTTTKPIFEEYIGKYMIKSIDFEHLTLGTLPPTIYGMKVYETNDNELIMEPSVRWAGNPNIMVVVKLLPLRITAQLLDLQVFAVPRIILKPLVPTFPCFANIVVSLMEKPHVDFGLKLLGVDIMSIPGLYQFVQETIKRQVAAIYLWPQTLDIPILDSSSVGARRKPVGILHVKVVKALKLLKMDFLGASDPYVKLSLSGEKLPSKKTSIKMKTLNPEWNEEFKLTVKNLQSQELELNVFDWEKVGTHDFLGMQVIPLKLLMPNEAREFTLDLLKNTNPDDPHNKKPRGKIVVELTFIPFKEESGKYSGSFDSKISKKISRIGRGSVDRSPSTGAGLLMVTILSAHDVEGRNHTNPRALIHFKGEKKKTKRIKRTRDPCWNEEFQFMLEEPPIKEKIHIEVVSKRKRFGLRSKESLGFVNVNLVDVVNNGQINEKFHLINSRNGVIHVEIGWTVV